MISAYDKTDKLREMRTRGREGVKNPENLADVVSSSPLRSPKSVHNDFHCSFLSRLFVVEDIVKFDNESKSIKFTLCPSVCVAYTLVSESNRSLSCQFVVLSVYRATQPHHLAFQLFNEHTNKHKYKQK